MARSQEIREAILEAMDDARRKEHDEHSEAKAAQEEYERGASVVHSKIGAFIDGLRQDPRYVVRRTDSKKSVTIGTGVPTEWDGLPDTAANFLGKHQDPKIGEVLTIDAYENKRVRTMQFRIGDIEGHTHRLIRILAASTWHGNALDIECASNSSLKDAPEPIVEAYNRIADFHHEGTIRRRAEMLKTAERLVEFGGREAVKAIRTQ